MIRDILLNKTATEKAQIKSQEIAKLNHVGTFDDATYGLRVEIQSFKAIEVNGSHGVEIMARAWKGTKQLGFGKDGSVEVERFRIFNPPVLVVSPVGSILHEWIDEKGITRNRRLEENSVEAIKQTLAHTVKLVGKEGTNVVPGKVGNTTSTFFPDADVESTSVDGDVFREGVGTWASVRDGAGTGASDTRNPQINARVNTEATSTDQFNTIGRSIQLFDTSSIPDTDTISSATFSVYGESVANNWVTATFSINVFSSAPASNTAVAAGDYGSLGTTPFSTAISSGAFSTAGYNDFVLNASGIANITKTGVSKFGMRESEHDAPNSAPAWEANDRDMLMKAFSAEAVGTTTDPKLVVVHSAAGGAASRRMRMGIGN